jgi:hypothetical protein
MVLRRVPAVAPPLPHSMHRDYQERSTHRRGDAGHAGSNQRRTGCNAQEAKAKEAKEQEIPRRRSKRLQRYIDLGFIIEAWAVTEPEAAERDANELAKTEAEEDGLLVPRHRGFDGLLERFFWPPEADRPASERPLWVDSCPSPTRHPDAPISGGEHWSFEPK